MAAKFKKGDLVCVRKQPWEKVIHHAVVLRVTEDPQGVWADHRAPHWAIVCWTNSTKGKVHLDDLEKVNDDKI